MNAHQLNANNVIVNTIVVDSLDTFPDLIDAKVGGAIGDRIVNGVVEPKPVIVPVPVEITMRQARLALLGAGKLAAVDAAIATMPEPNKTAAKIEWEYSNSVLRHNGFVSALGPMLGLTEAQIDALFIAGAKL